MLKKGLVVEKIMHEGRITVSDLCASFPSSVSQMRRFLTVLAREGYILFADGVAEVSPPYIPNGTEVVWYDKVTQRLCIVIGDLPFNSKRVIYLQPDLEYRDFVARSDDLELYVDEEKEEDG